MTLSCREEVKLIVRRRLSLIIQLDGTCPSPHGDPDWLREEKMLNAAKTIVNDTAGRNWERQHAAGTCPSPHGDPSSLRKEGVGGDGDDFKLK